VQQNGQSAQGSGLADPRQCRVQIEKIEISGQRPMLEVSFCLRNGATAREDENDLGQVTVGYYHV